MIFEHVVKTKQCLQLIPEGCSDGRMVGRLLGILTGCFDGIVVGCILVLCFTLEKELGRWLVVGNEVGQKPHKKSGKQKNVRITMYFIII